MKYGGQTITFCVKILFLRKVENKKNDSVCNNERNNFLSKHNLIIIVE